MQKYSIAIVLVNFNNNIDTIDCVESIAKSEGVKLPFIVVVDNNSKQKNIDKQLSFYQHLKVIYNENNVGFGRANNEGIDWVFNYLNTDYIFILNNDTIITPNTLYNLVRGFENNNNENIAMIVPKILTNDVIPLIWYAGGNIDWKTGTAKCYNLLKPRNDNLANISHFPEFASGCAMFFKTKILKQIGLFDNHFFMYEEDVELSLRLKRFNYKIFYFNEAEIFHKCQGSIDTSSKELNLLSPKNTNLIFYLNQMIPNRIYNMNKYAKGINKLIFNFYFPIYWILKSIQYTINKRFDGAKVVLKYLINRKNE